MWIVAFVLFAAPFLFGSNRPVFWLTWSAVLSLATALWSFRMGWSGVESRIRVADVWWALAIFIALGLYMVVQIVPAGVLATTVHSVADPTTPIHLAGISVTPGDTLLALVRWTTYALLAWLTLQVAANQARSKTLIALIYWSIVIHAFLGLALLFQFGDTIFGIEKWSYQNSATGGFVNRNSFATFLAFGSVLGVVKVVERLIANEATRKGLTFFDEYFGKNGILPLALSWVVVIIALIATNSRMGILAACCGMFMVLVLAFAKAQLTERRRALRFLLVLIPLIIVGGVTFYGGALVDRLGNLESGDADVRLNIYRQVLQMLHDRPLIGFGGNSFEYAYPLYHQAPVNFDLVWDKAHSTYLALWTEYGLIFGSLPLLLTLLLFVALLRQYMRSEKFDVAVVAALGIIVNGAVHSLVDFSLEIEAVTFVFVTVVAAGYARCIQAAASENRS